MPLLLVLFCCALLGCSHRVDRPETASAKGTVKYRGKPVAGATVAFYGHKSPRIASGETDFEGRFQLTTFESNDGAVPGTHVVTVHKPAQRIEAMGIDPNLSPEKYVEVMEQAAARAIKAQAAGSLLPAKYADAKTSDLSVEVVPGENEFNIELVD